jgi:hypothetical protein
MSGLIRRTESDFGKRADSPNVTSLKAVWMNLRPFAAKPGMILNVISSTNPIGCWPSTAVPGAARSCEEPRRNEENKNVKHSKHLILVITIVEYVQFVIALKTCF